MITTKEKEQIINDCVVVLGSGSSINELTDTQRTILDSCKVKIAINKYGAFYEKAKVVPSHIFFQDDYDVTSRCFLKYIINFFRSLKLEGVTFVVSINYKGFFFSNRISYTINKFKMVLSNFCGRLFTSLLRKILKPFSKSVFNHLKKNLEINFPYYELSRLAFLPPKSNLVYVKKQPWDKRGNIWQVDLSKPLYHYRGSFSSVLNYISIEYPNRPILLAGVDFNESGYFFSEELSKISFDVTDWTTDISEKNNKHFSIIDYKGTKMDDELPFMIENLLKTNNVMYSLSRKSYLVEKKIVDYIDL